MAKSKKSTTKKSTGAKKASKTKKASGGSKAKAGRALAPEIDDDELDDDTVLPPEEAALRILVTTVVAGMTEELGLEFQDEEDMLQLVEHISELFGDPILATIEAAVVNSTLVEGA